MQFKTSAEVKTARYDTFKELSIVTSRQEMLKRRLQELERTEVELTKKETESANPKEDVKSPEDTKKHNTQHSPEKSKKK